MPLRPPAPPPSPIARSEPLSAEGHGRRLAVLVLGMHRSGTSVLTRAIALLGASLPSDLHPPGADNPDGYWEPAGLQRINDRLLQAAGSAWLDIAPLDLGAVLRLGIPREASLRWLPAAGFEPLRDFTETQGRTWGGRVELIGRAVAFLKEFSQLAPRFCAPGQDVEVRLRYDDVGLQIALSWVGEPLAKAGRPDIDTDDGSLQVTLMHHWADEMRSAPLENGRQSLTAYVDDR